MPDSSRSGSAAASLDARATPSRRDRLRDFQSGLAERLRRAQGSPLSSNRLGFAIGTRRLLVDLAHAGEILALPEITPVPLTQRWFRGLANVRGNLVGIVDLSAFAGGPPTLLDKESRVLAFASDLQLSCGILVSRMLGLRSAADLAVAPDESAAGDPWAAWLSARLVDAQRGQWQELDLARLCADPRFIEIARG